jgi:hypothetical protein
VTLQANLTTVAPLGGGFYAPLEFGATGTQWYAGNGADNCVAGMIGHVTN